MPAKAEIQPTPNLEPNLAEQLQQLRARNWRAELASFAGFTGDLEKGTRILEAFSAGIADLITAMKRRQQILPGYVIPPINLVVDDVNDVFYYFEAERENNLIRLSQSSINISATYLNNLTLYPTAKLSAEGAEWTAGKITVFILGRPADLAYQTAVEEAAHSVFVYNDLSRTGGQRSIWTLPQPFNEISLAMYDAMPSEYHALGWKIRLIMEASNVTIPAEMVDIILAPLRRRLQKAIEMRNDLESRAATAGPGLGKGITMLVAALRNPRR